MLSATRASTLLSALATTLIVLIAGCSSVPIAPKPSAATPAKPAPSSARQMPLPAAGSGRGGYYQDDGPGENPPANVLAIPDAEPKIEPVKPGTNRPYVVFGKTYTPLAADQPLKQRGIGSWYGKKFHGQKTASGERYDMYKMTAAHPTMPLPSYARVTNLSNGKQVIVRVNDRGPFHSSRIIDLSYTAAMKLGYVGKGSSELEVERLLPDEIARLEKSRLGERAVVQVDTAKLTPPPAPMPPVAAIATPVEPTVQPQSEPLDLMANPPISSTEAVPVIEPATAPAITASGSVAGGIYLQLGAFSQALNAEAARARLSHDAIDILPPLEIAQAGSVFKLFSGPFQTRSDAALAAQKILDASGAKPFIVQR